MTKYSERSQELARKVREKAAKNLGREVDAAEFVKKNPVTGSIRKKNPGSNVSLRRPSVDLSEKPNVLDGTKILLVHEHDAPPGFSRATTKGDDTLFMVVGVSDDFEEKPGWIGIRDRIVTIANKLEDSDIDVVSIQGKTPETRPTKSGASLRPRSPKSP